MRNVMAHSATRDDRFVTVQELSQYPAPPRTDTYSPVSHFSVAEIIAETTRRAGWGEPEDVGVVLASKGQRMFGVANFRHTDDRNIAIGFRNSYDRSVSLGIASGQSVMVCSNLCFSGRDATYMRRHTGSCLSDFRVLVSRALEAAVEETEKLDREIAFLQGKPCDLDTGYSILGRMLGHNVITAHQMTRALQEWREPSLEEHNTRNGWGLYNALTQGLKQGNQPTVGRYAGVHGWLLKEAGYQG